MARGVLLVLAWLRALLRAPQAERAVELLHLVRGWLACAAAVRHAVAVHCRGLWVTDWSSRCGCCLSGSGSCCVLGLDMPGSCSYGVIRGAANHCWLRCGLLWRSLGREGQRCSAAAAASGPLVV